MTENPRRDTSPVTAIAVLAVALVVFVLVVAGILWFRFDSIEEQNRDDRNASQCRSVLIADLFADSFDALAAPPVDPTLTPEQFAKTQRGRAVISGSAGAAKLHEAAEVCP